MKKHYVYLMLLLGALFISLKSHDGFKNSGQAPIGRTGAPGETSCASCHSGGSYTGETLFMLGDNSQTTYQPGESYTVSFTADYNAPRYGFSVTALDASNNPAGEFTLLNEDNTSWGQAGNGRQYVGHKAADATHQWTFEWEAPAADVGEITFYYVINAANADNGTGGDYVETGSATFLPAQEDEFFLLTLQADPPEAGTVSGEGEYQEAEVVAVSASANQGYDFLYWADVNENIVSEQPEFDYTMPAEDITLVAHFQAHTYTLTFVVETQAGEEIPDAVITLEGESYDAGVYVFEDLLPGSYAYTVSKDGYLDHSGEVVIEDADKTHTVILEEDETGINDYTEPVLSVFPNPAASYLEILSRADAIEEVKIIDITGSVVFHSKMQQNHHHLDVSALAAGMYIVKIKALQKIHTFKVQINP